MVFTRRKFLEYSAYSIAGIVGGASSLPQHGIQPNNRHIQSLSGSVEFDFENKRINFHDEFDPLLRESFTEFPKPGEFAVEGEGDCDDYATMVASFAEAQGYENRLVAGIVEYESENKSDIAPHMIAEVKNEDYDWHICDINNIGNMMKDWKEIYEDTELEKYEFYPVYTARINNFAKPRLDGTTDILESCNTYGGLVLDVLKKL